MVVWVIVGALCAVGAVWLIVAKLRRIRDRNRPATMRLCAFLVLVAAFGLMTLLFVTVNETARGLWFSVILFALALGAFAGWATFTVGAVAIEARELRADNARRTALGLVRRRRIMSIPALRALCWTAVIAYFFGSPFVMIGLAVLVGSDIGAHDTTTQRIIIGWGISFWIAVIACWLVIARQRRRIDAEERRIAAADQAMIFDVPSDR